MDDTSMQSTWIITLWTDSGSVGSFVTMTGTVDGVCDGTEEANILCDRISKYVRCLMEKETRK